jgi:superfamily II DNA/RNA helicase
MDKPLTVQALYIAPSRELARNHALIIKELGSFIPNLSVTVKYSSQPREKVESQILVSTPGLALDLISSRHLCVSGVKVLTFLRIDDILSRQLDDFSIELRR